MLSSHAAPTKYLQMTAFACLAFGLPSEVRGACPGVIVSGEVQTATQVVIGASCTVAQGGTITTAGVRETGIAGSLGATVLNFGSIRSGGFQSQGIYVDGNSFAENAGTIRVDGADAYGLGGSEARP